MKLRFQADANFNNIIVKAVLRHEPSIDFQVAHTANLAYLTDLQVLERCANEHRLLVTHDRKTMPQHFAEFVSLHSSPGVLIIPQNMPIAEAVELLISFWSESDSEDWQNRIYCV